jgi:hypothetical protein
MIKKSERVLSAAIFHPYLKQQILRNFGALVDRNILAQLHDTKINNFFEEYVKQQVNENVNSEHLDSESEEENLYGANKKLKFDDYNELSQEQDEDEVAGEEYQRYKDSRLGRTDIEILFGGKVILF